MSATLESQTPGRQRAPDEQPGRPKRPPRARGSVLFDTVRFTLDPDGYFASVHRRHGDVFTIRLLGQEWVAIADPEAVREVFSHGPDALHSGVANQSLSPALGTRNLLLLDGDEHLHRRRLVLPPFHGERMRAYERTIRAAAARQIARWPLGEALAAGPRMQALTFEVIVSCVFGVQEEQRMAELGAALRGMIAWLTDLRRVLFFFMVGSERLELVPSFRRQRERVDLEILAEIERLRSLGDLHERDDILSMLIQAVDENGEQLTDTELRDELMTLLLAGHETTATLLSWAIHDLARDPVSQERVAVEGGAFTDAVVTEALRLHPPTGGVVRRLREPLTIAGYELAQGADVLPVTLLVHRRADVYPQPWRFDPTRFLESRPAAGAWFPFGGSVRRCIGAAFAQFEAKIVLEELTRALRFRPAQQRPERTSRRAIVLVPSKGARVIARPR